MINARTICLALFIAVFLLLGTQAIQIGGLTGSYPQALIVLSLLFTVWMIVVETRTAGAAQRRDAGLTNLWRRVRGQKASFAIFILIWIAYPFLLTLAGFLIATTVVLAISLLTGNRRRPVITVFISALVSVIIAVLITSFLYIPVSSGPLDLLLEQALYALGSS